MTPVPPAPRISVPGYEVGERLGAGSAASVHRARSGRLGGREVAVKRVPTGGDPALTAQLRHEADVLSALDHPHIVRILEVMVDGDGVAIAMQLAPGGSLADRLERRGRLSPAEVVRFAAPVADALASAHRRGVLHCDVKPANVLFTSDGEALLSDFGLARWGGGSHRDGTVEGTAGYLDPAVAAGAAPAPTSDVYALGVVCYEALAGRLPFTGATAPEVLRAAASGQHQRLAYAAPGVGAELAGVVERAMALRPEDRFGGAAEMAGALRSAGRSHLPPPPGRRRGAGWARTIRRRPKQEAITAAAPSAPPMPAALARTASFGPRPVAPAGPPPRRSPGRGRVTTTRTLAGAAGAVVLAAVLGLPGLPDVTGGGGAVPRSAAAAAGTIATTGRHAGPPGGPPTGPHAGPPSGPTTSTAGAGCGAVPRVGTAAGAGITITGDLDGNGCVTGVQWAAPHIVVPPGAGRKAGRYDLGRAGDELLLGDWDCDGRDTAGLYRPGTGEVFLFSTWPHPGRTLAPATIARTPVRNGRAAVRRRLGGGACARVEVRPLPP